MRKIMSQDLDKYCKNCGTKIIFEEGDNKGKDTYTLVVTPINGKQFVYHDNSKPPYYVCYECLEEFDSRIYDAPKKPLRFPSLKEFQSMYDLFKKYPDKIV